MVHFQTNFKKSPPQGAAAPWGHRWRWRQGYVSKNLFENGPYLAHPIFKIAIELLVVFQNFTTL